MTAVLVKPAFQSAIADSGDTTKLGPNAWNAARLFSDGILGDFLYRDTGSATGASYLTGAAGIPYWSGAGVAPVVTVSPSLTSVLFPASPSVFYPWLVDLAAVDDDSPPFRFGVKVMAGVNGADPRADVVATLGWNMQAGGGRVDTSEVAMGIALENYYVAGGVPQSEMHLTSFDLSGVEHRAVTIGWPRSGGAGSSLGFQGDTIYVKNDAGTVKLQGNFAGAGGALVVPEGVAFQFNVNNVPVAKQFNAALGALLNLPYFGSDDRLRFEGPTAILGPTPTTGTYANTFLALQPTTLAADGRAIDIVLPAITGHAYPIQMAGAVTGRLVARIYNSSNTSGASAVLWLDVLAAGGDPYVRYYDNGAFAWAVGMDRSDSGKFVWSQTTPGNANQMVLTQAGALTVTAGFGCNTKAAQGSFASGGALATYGAGANGLDSGANMSALHALVVAMRAALVANGIMS